MSTVAALGLQQNPIGTVLRRKASPLLSIGVKRLWYLIAVVVAAVVAGFALVGPSPDADNYRILFEWVTETDMAEIASSGDPGYLAFSRLAYLSGLGLTGFMFVIALLTCAAKAAVIWRLDTNRTVLVALYASYLFWLHDYTQVRVALALALVMLGIYTARHAKWLLFLAAISVHASVIAVIVLYATSLYPRKAALALILGLPVVYGLGLIDGFLRGVALRITSYTLLHDLGEFDQLNIFSLMPLAQGLMVLLAIRHMDRLTRLGRTELMFSVVGVASFYLLSFLPVLAFRTYELFIPFFLILVSRLWGHSAGMRLITVIYIALGLRVSFFSSNSLLPLF